MPDVTRILTAIEEGDTESAEALLPLVYDELRKLAVQRMAGEKPGQTLQPTALVHEAYLRLTGGRSPQHWKSRGHFFGAAAEAMRRILVETARRKTCAQHGGNRKRVDLEDFEATAAMPPDDLLALNDALALLETHDQAAAELVKLRYFAGFSVEEASEMLGISRSSAYRHWTYARAWLFSRLHGEDSTSR